MTLPDALPKLIVAGWIAQCLALCALAERDRVFVAPLFLPEAAEPIAIRAPRDLASVQALVAGRLQAAAAPDGWSEVPAPDLRPVLRLLDSTAAVVLVSDMLFDDAAHQIAGFARRVQKGYRSLHVVELDSWRHERALMEDGPFRLDAVEGHSFAGDHFEASAEFVDGASQRIADHKAGLREKLQGPGLIWPEVPLELQLEGARSATVLEDWFRGAFASAGFLPSLLSRAVA